MLKLSKLKKFILLTTIFSVLVIIALSITASAATYKYDDLGRLTEVTYIPGRKSYIHMMGGNILTVKEVSVIKLNPIGNKTVFAGEELKFTVTGVGQEGSDLVLCFQFAGGCGFDSQTREFSWIPTSTQVGVYTKVTFQVTDGTNTSKQEITITVQGKL